MVDKPTSSSDPAPPAPLDLTYYGASSVNRWSASPLSIKPLSGSAASSLGQHFAQALDRIGPDGKTYITLPQTSLHIGNHGGIDRRFNADNQGLGVEMTVSENASVIAGAYVNSYNRQTLYAGVAYTPLKTSIGPVDLSAGVVGGVATGYARYAPDISSGPFTPVLGLHFSAAVGATGFNLTVMPPARGPNGVTALAFAAKFEI